jgi:hypothetical protein
MKGVILVFIIASLLSTSFFCRAESSDSLELSLRREAEAKISLGDYSGAEVLLARLKSIKTGPAEPAPALSPPLEPKTKTITFFDWMTNSGFVLQRAAGKPGEGDPAEFAFLRDFQSGVTTYTADFFLGYSPNRVRDSETNKLTQPSYHPFGLASDLTIDASVEAKLTSDQTAAASDAWRFRLGGTLDTSSLGGFFDSTYTTVALKSESNQHFDASRLSAEIWFTPTKSSLAIGRYQPQPAPDYPILFRWRPYLGVDLGGTVSSAKALQQMSDQRLMFRATGTVLFPFLAKSLRLHEISLFADNYVYYLVENETGHDYVTAGLNLMFNDNVGFKLTVKVGADAPQFKYEETLGGALSLKF